MVVTLRMEKKGRGGKTVTVVAGLPRNDALLRDLCQELKRACGTGGTVAEDTIELQGDNDFTITYGNGGSSSGTGFVGTKDGYLRIHSDQSTLTMPIHFVGNGVIKGTYHLGHGTQVWEAKFTVRKN